MGTCYLTEWTQPEWTRTRNGMRHGLNFMSMELTQAAVVKKSLPNTLLSLSLQDANKHCVRCTHHPEKAPTSLPHSPQILLSVIL